MKENETGKIVINDSVEYRSLELDPEKLIIFIENTFNIKLYSHQKEYLRGNPIKCERQQGFTTMRLGIAYYILLNAEDDVCVVAYNHRHARILYKTLIRIITDNGYTASGREDTGIIMAKPNGETEKHIWFCTNNVSSFRGFRGIYIRDDLDEVYNHEYITVSGCIHYGVPMPYTRNIHRPKISDRSSVGESLRIKPLKIVISYDPMTQRHTLSIRYVKWRQETGFFEKRMPEGSEPAINSVNWHDGDVYELHHQFTGGLPPVDVVKQIRETSTDVIDQIIYEWLWDYYNYRGWIK